jgi:hypothetical protein
MSPFRKVEMSQYEREAYPCTANDGVREGHGWSCVDDGYGWLPPCPYKEGEAVSLGMADENSPQQEEGTAGHVWMMVTVGFRRARTKSGTR